MVKKLFFATILSALYAQDEVKMLQEHAIDVQIVDGKGNVRTVTVARESDIRCRQVPFDGKTFWSGEYARDEAPTYCKKTFITAAGTLSPMKIHDEIETYGELEVLDFMEEMQEDDTMLFVDSRKSEWFEALSIPGAINVPFIYFTEAGKWEKEKQAAMKLFGIANTKEGYDFTNAKTVLFFCNGIWCRQSPQMIEALLSIGYPPAKIKWYRGGLQSWLSVGLTSTRSTR